MTTETGYRGVLRDELASMESPDGERITGTRGGSIIDLHVEYEGATLRASGMFAGRLGRLLMDAAELTTTFGSCSMQLFRQRGLVYSGQRACSDGRIAPGGGAVAQRDPPAAATPAGDAAGDAVLSVSPVRITRH